MAIVIALQREGDLAETRWPRATGQAEISAPKEGRDVGETGAGGEAEGKARGEGGEVD